MELKSIKPEQLFCNLLLKLIQGETEIENLRKIISINPLFNPVLLFNSIKKNQNSAIDSDDIFKYLKSKKITYSKTQIELMTRQYSSSGKCLIKYEDFLKLVLPSTSLDSFLDSLKHSNDLENDLFRDLTKLIITEIELQIDLEDMKRSLFIFLDFPVHMAFSLINKSRTGFITKEELIVFFEKYGKILSGQDFDSLLRRVDYRNDRLIDLQEFLDGMSQKEDIKNPEERTRNQESGWLVKTNKITQDLTRQSHCQKDAKTDHGKINENSDEFLLDDQQKAIEILTKELEAEKKYDYLKENLIMISNFSVFQLFKLIDTDSKGIITVKDFKIFLQSMHIECSENLLFCIFKRLESGPHFILTLNSFSLLFVCQNSEYTDFLYSHSSQSALSQMTQEKIKSFFQFFIESERLILDCKFSIIKSNNLTNLFLALDMDKDNLLSENDLKRSFKSFGIFCNTTDVSRLVSRYTVSEHISLEHFISNFPIS